MTETREPRYGGPFLAAALFCERVIEDKEGVLTLVRIVDRVVNTAIGSGTPSVMPAARISLNLLLAFKSGDARGRHDVQIHAEEPSGLRKTVAHTMSIFFEGEDRGANLIVNLSFEAPQEGLYWFDIFLDDVRVTRIPLRLVYQRQETGPPGTAPHPDS